MSMAAHIKGTLIGLLTLIVFIFGVKQCTAFLLDTVDLDQLCFPRSTVCSCALIEGELVVDCMRQNLSKTPAFTSISAVLFNMTEDFKIVIGNNNITEISGDAFRHFHQVNTNRTTMYIDLGNNHISLVAYNAFVGIESVFLNLNFTSNNLTSLPQGLLTLKNLFGLYLGLNPLLILESSIMQHIGLGITELELSMAFIPTWPVELKMFTQMGWLVFYDLKRNILPTNAFAGFEYTLYYLAVIGGDLVSIPCSFTMNSIQVTISLQHLTNIHSPQVLETCLSNYTAKFNKLTLINGSLREFPDLLSYMPDLVELDLSYNQIALVNDSFLPLIHKIEIITLNNNLLAVVPNGLLKLTSLRELNLENNKIATLPAVLQIRPANSHYLRVCVSGNPAENSPEIQQQPIHIVGCISYKT